MTGISQSRSEKRTMKRQPLESMDERHECRMTVGRMIALLNQFDENIELRLASKNWRSWHVLSVYDSMDQKTVWIDIEKGK